LRAINTPYGEMGLVANFECQRPHRGIARQWFRHDGVLAWLPMAGNRVSIVWSTPDENALAMLALPAEELCSRVAAAGNHELGAFQLLTPATAFPLRLMRVPQIVAPRWHCLATRHTAFTRFPGTASTSATRMPGTGRSAGGHAGLAGHRQRAPAQGSLSTAKARGNAAHANLYARPAPPLPAGPFPESNHCAISE
jgi:hypothetical protein